VSGWRLVHGQAGAVPRTFTTEDLSNTAHPPLAKYAFGLAQVLAGNRYDLDADRVVAVLCTLVTALVMGLLVGRVVGRWTGLLTAALLLLLPASVTPQLTRFGRNGMLDPVAELFMVASVGLTWGWLRASGRRAVLWAVALGVAVGLATGCKENGFLGAVGPVALGVLLARAGGWRAVARRGGQAALAVVAALLVFLATYLPLGDAFGRISYLIRFQSDQSSVGHVIAVAGRVSAHPPWWANLWFAGQGLGEVTSLVLLVSILLAVVLVRTRFTLVLVAAVAGPVVFHCFIAGVTLPYYWTLWEPAALALAAVGITAVLARLAAALRTREPGLGGVRAVLLWLVPALVVAATPTVAAAGELARTATVRPFGADVLPGLLAAQGVTGTVGETGLAIPQLAFYLPSSRLGRAVTPASTRWQAVVVAEPGCRVLIDQGIRALVAVNLASGRLRLVHRDRTLQVYRATGALMLPTPAQVAQQPPASVTAGCR
jgi:4-amino-4-deoxy-L-arabinose transferase-like glycosyltransferase